MQIVCLQVLPVITVLLQIAMLVVAHSNLQSVFYLWTVADVTLNVIVTFSYNGYL